MHSPAMFFGATAVPVSAAATDSLSDGNIWAAIIQLGIGGVFVVFAAFIYQRFEKRADIAASTHKAELDALEAKLVARHEADVANLRAELNQTRQNYLDLLKEQRNS